MPSNLLLDGSTIRSAAAVICQDGRYRNNSTLLDVDITALGHLVDSIVLATRVYYVPMDKTKEALARLALHKESLFESVDVPADFLNDLEKSPHRMKVHDYILRSSLKEDARLFDLIGMTFNVVAGMGYAFRISCRKAAYEYLVGTNADTSRLLHAIEGWHERSDWFALKRREMDRNLERRIHWAEHFARKDYYSWPDDMKDQLLVEDETFRLIHILFWLIERAVFYSLLSSTIDCIYFPSSLRSNLLALTNMCLGREIEKSGLALIIKELEATLEKSLHWLLCQEASIPLLTLTHPPFFQYVCNKVDHPDLIVPYALELRETKGARTLRSLITEIESLRKSGKNLELHEISRRFDRFSGEMCRWMTSGTTPIQPTKFLRVLGLPVVQYDKLLVTLKLPSIAQKPFYPGMPYLALLRDLTRDLLEAYSLGESYEKLFREPFGDR